MNPTDPAAGEGQDRSLPAGEGDGDSADVPQTSDSLVVSAVPLARPVTWKSPAPAIELREISRLQALLDPLIVGAVMVATGFFLLLTLFLMNPQGADGTSPSIGLMVTTTTFFVGLGLIGVLTRWRRLSWQSLGLVPQQWMIDLLLGPVVSTALFATMMVVGIFLMVLWPEAAEGMSKAKEAIEGALPRMRPPALLALSLVVGAYEEITFRGFLLPRLHRATGSWTAAVILSSAVFGALHFYEGWSTPLVIFALGVVLSLFVIWRRNIIAAGIGHALFNAVQLIMLYYTSSEWE